jgi:heme-degrading monooxygenase HmoA
MFMRVVHLKVKTGLVDRLYHLYDANVVPALASVRGCRYAGLLQSAGHPEDCISLTLWSAEADAKAYESSGVYTGLLEGTRPLLVESSESMVRLAENLTLEYVLVPEEPVVRSLPVALTMGSNVNGVREKADIWVRIVQLRIRPEKLEGFKQRYAEHVIPVLRNVKGIRHVYLTEQEGDPGLLASVTTWDSRSDAEAYENSGLYTELIDSQREFLSPLYEWKRHREGSGRPGVVTSEDLVVEQYTVLTGRTF